MIQRVDRGSKKKATKKKSKRKKSKRSRVADAIEETSTESEESGESDESGREAAEARAEEVDPTEGEEAVVDVNAADGEPVDADPGDSDSIDPEADDAAEGPALDSSDEEAGDSAEPSAEAQSEGSEDAGPPADDDEPERLEGDRLKQVLEAVLFASPEALSLRRLNRMLKEAKKADIEEQLLALEGELALGGRGYGLVLEGGGYRLLTRTDLAPYVARLRGERKRIRLSKAAFETLAIIAYRQPIRRADLDAIRGVQSGTIVKNLLEWNLVRVVDRDEEIGRALRYGTTEEFLDQFGISGLDELPDPSAFHELGASSGVEVSADDAGAPEVSAEADEAELPESEAPEAGDATKSEPLEAEPAEIDADAGTDAAEADESDESDEPEERVAKLEAPRRDDPSSSGDAARAADVDDSDTEESGEAATEDDPS